MTELQKSNISLFEAKIKMIKETTKHCEKLITTLIANIESRDRLIDELFFSLKESYKK